MIRLLDYTYHGDWGFSIGTVLQVIIEEIMIMREGEEMK